MKKLFALEPVELADGICEGDRLVFKARDSHTAPPPFLFNTGDIVGKLSEIVDPFILLSDLYAAAAALLPYAESRAEDIGDDYIESEGDEIPKAEALMIKAQETLMRARRALHRAEAVIDRADVAEDEPLCECGRQPDMCATADGKEQHDDRDFGGVDDDDPPPPATLDEDVIEAIRNGSLGSEEVEILPTPPSRSDDDGWWVEVRVWIRDRDEG